MKTNRINKIKIKIYKWALNSIRSLLRALNKAEDNLMVKYNKELLKTPKEYFRQFGYKSVSSKDLFKDLSKIIG